MPSPTLSSQFVKVLIGTGAGVEVVGYTNADTQLRHDMSDQTTFAAGGGPITETQIHGAITSEWSLETVYSEAVIQALEPQVGSRTGTLFRVYSGSNALPTVGDELFSGYFSIFGVTWNYNAGADVRLKWDLKIPDGAPVAAPSISTI